MATQIGPKIGIEGEKEYRQQLKQIINETKNLDAAMEKTASEWTKNTSAMTKNKAIAQNLAQQIEVQNEKLSIMNKMLDESAQKFGENSDATKAWQRAVDSATASLNNMENELKSMGGAESFTTMQTKLADVGTKMQNIGQSMMSVGQKLTTSLTLPIAAAATAAIKLGSDLQESANKVEVVFGSMSQSVKDFAKTTTDAYAISEGKALEMAGDYGAMATSMGLSQQEAARLSTQLVGLAGDMASFHNKSIEVAQNSLKGVFTGETESLKQFGVAMTQTNLEEFAAKQGKVYNSMSQSEKIMTRYQFLLESQKDAIGDAGRTMDGFAGSTRKLKAAFENAASSLGEALIPVITPLIQILTKLMQKFAELPAPVQSFIAVLLVIVAAIGPIIMIIGAFVSSLGAIVSGIPAVITGLSGLAAAFGLVDIAAAPLIGIILAIAAAIAIGAVAGYELAKHWDEICDAAGRMASAISNAYNSVMALNDSLKNSVNGAIQDIISYFASLPSRVVNVLKNTVNAIKNEFKQTIQNAKQSGADFVSGFIDGIKSKVQPLIDQVKKIAKTIEDYLGFSTPDKGPLHKYNTWMPDFLNGLAKGIRQNENVVISAMNGLAKSMTLPLDSSASMNMALSGAGGGSVSVGGTSMNVYVDHISDIQDLVRIQNQAQQMRRMGAN